MSQMNETTHDTDGHTQLCDASVVHSRKERKRRKFEQIQRGEWDKCMFWVKRKHRYCGMNRLKGEMFCAPHLREGASQHIPAKITLKNGQLHRTIIEDGSSCPIPGTSSDVTRSSELPSEQSSHSGTTSSKLAKQRIPCPLDPSHDVWSHKLKQHLERCNANKKQAAMATAKYFVPNLNCGMHHSSNLREKATEKDMRFNIYSEIEALGGEEVMFDLIDRLYESYVGTIPTEFFSYKSTENKAYATLVCNDCAPLRPDASDATETSHTEHTVPSIHTREQSIHDTVSRISEKSVDIQHRGRSGTVRHEEQQDSIVGHLEQRGLLKSSFTYLELGAGRAMLSHSIAKRLQNASYVLIDRSSVRRKADRMFRQWIHPKSNETDISSIEEQLDNKKNDIPTVSNHSKSFTDNNTDQSKHSNVKSSETYVEPTVETFERVTADLKDIWLGGISSIQNKPVVGIAKHLCGAATDLALMALYNGTCIQPCTISKHRIQQNDKAQQYPDKFQLHQTLPRLCGIAIATCCHHRCEWNMYVGQMFWQDILKLTERHFKLFSHLCGWATGGLNSNEIKGDQDDTATSIHTQNTMEQSQATPMTTREQSLRKVIIGRKCKRLIDVGRLFFLKQWPTNDTFTTTKLHEDTDVDAQLVHYCETALSPENALLIASMNVSSSLKD